MPQIFREILRYGAVSAVALAVDASVLYSFVNWANWHYLPASALGFSAGATVAYVLSVRLVFSSRQLHNPSLEFASFVALGVAGLCVNAAVLFIGISAVGLGLVTSKVLAAGCTFATNFTLRRQLLFSPPRAR
jgi:putative flippase GtrA